MKKGLLLSCLKLLALEVKLRSTGIHYYAKCEYFEIDSLDCITTPRSLLSLHVNNEFELELKNSSSYQNLCKFLVLDPANSFRPDEIIFKVVG